MKNQNQNKGLNESQRRVKKMLTGYTWAALLLLFPLNLLAQEETQDPATGEQQAVSSSEQPEAASGAQTSSETPATASSPFDYQASEKISEDLSVSFPVDI